MRTFLPFKSIVVRYVHGWVELLHAAKVSHKLPHVFRLGTRYDRTDLVRLVPMTHGVSFLSLCSTPEYS